MEMVNKAVQSGRNSQRPKKKAMQAELANFHVLYVAYHARVTGPFNSTLTRITRRTVHSLMAACYNHPLFALIEAPSLYYNCINSL